MNIKKLIVPMCSVFLLVGCAKEKDVVEVADKESTVESTESKYEEIVSDFKNIEIEDIYEMLKNGDYFFLYIGRESCGYCQIFAPKLKEAVDKEKIKMFYVDTHLISENDEMDIFLKSLNTQTVPSLYSFNEGEFASELIIDSVKINVEDIQKFLKIQND